MKQIAKGFMSVVLVLLIVALGFVIYGNYANHRQAMEEEQRLQESPTPIVTPTPEASPSPSPESENNVDISIAVLGDIVCHSGLNAEAKQDDGSYNYVPIFDGALSSVQAADYAICTMETTFPDTVEYSGYPMFKSPTDLAKSLKEVGFDLVNTASNHCMDGLKGGLFRTLDVLDENGLDHVGTYRSQEERDKNNGILVKDINGVSVAIVSYTYGTNAIPVDGFEYAVNLIFNDYTTTLRDIDYDSLKADMAAARALDTDMIIAMMHWGNEYERSPIVYQTELADFLFAEGADIVLGGHVHVPEPMELRHVVDNEGNEKTGYIVYCMGNLISCQNDRYTNLTAALDLTIRKNLDTGETYLKHVSYKPLFMVDLGDYGISSSWQYKLWDTRAAIESYESGDNMGVINQRLYDALIVGLDDLHSVFDPAFDEANGGVDVVAWAEENS